MSTLLINLIVIGVSLLGIGIAVFYTDWKFNQSMTSKTTTIKKS